MKQMNKTSTTLELEPDKPFTEFVEEIVVLLEAKAKEKYYNDQGINGYNKLYNFVSDTVDGPGHAIGEIIYKSRRYMAMKDKKDLVKIAAWAYLIWMFDTK